MRHLNCFLKIHSVHLQTFYQMKSIWKGNGRMQFRKLPTLQCTRMLQMGNIYYSKLRKLLQNDNGLLLGTWAVFFGTRHCGSNEFAYTREKQSL